MPSQSEKPSKQLEPHGAARLCPPMTEQEYAELKADIEEQGQRVPIILLDGQILDGRHRYRACIELGIKPLIKSAPKGVDPEAFVLSANVHRRQLTASQRALVAGRVVVRGAAKVMDEAQDGAEANGKDGRGSHKKKSVANLPPATKSRDQAGDLLGVSGRSVQNAITVLEKGLPELIAAVESGRMSVSRAAKVADSGTKRSRLPPRSNRKRHRLNEPMNCFTRSETFQSLD